MQKRPMAVPNDLFQCRQTASLTIANHNCSTPPSSLLSSERSCSCRCNWAALAYPAKLSAWHHKPKNSWNSRRLPTKKTSISFKHTTFSPPFDCSLRRTGSSRTSSIFIACFKAVVEHMRKSQLHTTMTLRLHNIVQPGVLTKVSLTSVPSLPQHSLPSTVTWKSFLPKFPSNVLVKRMTTWHPVYFLLPKVSGFSSDYPSCGIHTQPPHWVALANCYRNSTNREPTWR